jgi:hypothetical protein
MRKQIFSIFVILLAIAGTISCSKEEFTERDAINQQNLNDSIQNVRDSLNRIGGVIEYSINVVQANGAGWSAPKDAKGITGASVTVSQFGVAVTKVTGESGIVVFSDLRIGTVNVNIKAEGFTDVDFVSFLKPEGDFNTTMWYNVQRFAATMVPIFSLETDNMSTIEGQVTYEANLTNLVPEFAEGIEVIATIDVTHASFTNTYILPQGPDYDYTGRILQIAYGGVGFVGVADTAGMYSINVPSTGNGLFYRLEVSDFAKNQILLLNTLSGAPVFGEQTVRTLFSSTIAAPTAVPVVPAAYVTFSAPTGSPTMGPEVDAIAAANITESGIVSINIANKGEGYTQPPIVRIAAPANYHYGTTATAAASLTNGRVTGVAITSPGSGYAPNANPAVTFIDKEGDDAVAVANYTYSITAINVTNGGTGYTSAPAISILSGSGSGAAATAVMSGYVDEITVTNSGNGYTCPPTVIVGASATGQHATATAIMRLYNPIHSIELTNNFTTQYETVPEVLVITSGTGSGARATATLANAGSVSRLELSNAGAGYILAPTVSITGGGGSGAVAYSTLNGDGSVNVFLAEGGAGYTSTPSVSISAPPSGGEQAIATAVRARPIQQIDLTAAGSGYNIVYVSPNVYNNQPIVQIAGANLTPNTQAIVRPSMAVESVAINNAGSGYPTAPTISFNPSCGTGSGAQATASMLYAVDRVTVNNMGSGYDWNSVVTVQFGSPANGTLATATAVKGNARLSQVVLTSGGEGYTAAPNVRILRLGVDAGPRVTATVANGAVTGFTVVDPTISYQFEDLAPTSFTLAISTKTMVATANAQANPESGKIMFVDILNPGRGYATVPTVRFVRVDNFNNPIENQNNPNFVNATGTANIVDGRIASVTVDNQGTGYYNPPRVELVVQTAVRTAKGTAIISADGLITGVTMTDAGNGYLTPPTVTFTASVTGMGSGAAATAILNGSTVQRVFMTNNGNGYLGKNYPTARTFVIRPAGNTFNATIGKTIVKDIYMGTGLRTIDSN